MKKIEEYYTIKIENTSNYGLIKENMTFYDDKRLLGEYLLNFKLEKIRCISKNNVGISGIQIFYKDRITSKTIIGIDTKNKINEDEEEQEITLGSNEMINEVTVWKDEALRGFEVKTNKGRNKKFGWCDEGTKIELKDELKDGDNYVVGIFCGHHKKEGVLCIGFYNVDKKSFYLILNLGIFMLRIKSKKEEFRKKIDENFNKLNKSDKVLYKACCLPNNTFFEIFKYIFV